MWPEQNLNEAFLLRGNGLTWPTFRSLELGYCSQFRDRSITIASIRQLQDKRRT